MTANKRVSLHLPKSFPSETLSILSSSDSKISSDGVLTIGGDTSDKEDKGNNSVQEGGLAQVRGTCAKPRGGRRCGTPLRLGSTLPSRHTKADGSSSKEESSSASMAIDSNNKSTDMASCKGKEDKDQHKSDSLDRSNGSQAARKHTSLVRGAPNPRHCRPSTTANVITPLARVHYPTTTINSKLTCSTGYSLRAITFSFSIGSWRCIFLATGGCTCIWQNRAKQSRTGIRMLLSG
jgi:hypothetical protein